MYTALSPHFTVGCILRSMFEHWLVIAPIPTVSTGKLLGKTHHQQ